MSAQIMKNTGLVILVTHIIKESGGCYVATCPEFMVTTQGKTIEDANNNLKEAVILHLETLEQLGIRDSVFKKRNIKVLKQKDKIKSKTIDLDLSKDSESFVTTQFVPIACGFANNGNPLKIYLFQRGSSKFFIESITSCLMGRAIRFGSPLLNTTEFI